MDAKVKEVLTKLMDNNIHMQAVNNIFQELVGLDIIAFYEFKEQHGEFAAMMLMQSRLANFRKDPMRDAVEELYNDKEFMSNISPEVTQMVHDALYHGQYSA